MAANHPVSGGGVDQAYDGWRVVSQHVQGLRNLGDVAARGRVIAASPAGSLDAKTSGSEQGQEWLAKLTNRA
jgi:hypothetical protein